jgi:uncharacterized membrane protein YccF (DUF307 family)
VLTALAALAALLATLLMTVAIVSLVIGRPGARAGFYIRFAALLAFGAAVGLNVAAHS